MQRVKLVVVQPKPGEIDYSYYLGKGYEYKVPKGKVPSYVSPHCSALDGPAIASALKGRVSFVAGDFLKKWPLFGFVARAVNSIFVPRGGTPEALTKTLNMIADRQKEIEEKGEYNPIVVFPEGCCSNNTCLLPFKKGSFYSLI